ncbi:MAG TPA: FAD-binding oxidoreductase [Bryobacteraceae bacterium]|nr:FAD-binding oxidoreductase [Bryobacteraceae bacterium]
MPDVTNWFGDVISHPAAVADATSVQDIIDVLKNPAKYPSPVRAVGSNHSTTACGTAEGGTVLRMKMNRILNVAADSLTIEAGAIHIDMAHALAKQNLQFYVNTEIGNLTAGSAACCGTKDSSFPGEYGQVGSYVTGVKMVLPSGELLEVTEAQPDLMRKVRASYGTFGIVYEVTFRIRPMLPLAVHHKTFHLADFVRQLPELKALNYAMMYYIFPFDDLITVEFRSYNNAAKGTPNKIIWPLRNYIWGTSGPRFAHDMEKTISDAKTRYGIIDAFNAIWRFKLENIITSDNTVPADEIIRYPDIADDSRYTFSLYAFPEEQYPSVLQDFFKFSTGYYAQKGYRPNLLDVGYRIAQDQQSWLSYSWDGPVMTIDPVSTGNPGWNEFIDAYNQFCSERNGKPVLNQTCGLTPDLAKRAFAGKLAELEQTRQQYDPSDRLLNDYFRGILT